MEEIEILDTGLCILETRQGGLENVGTVINEAFEKIGKRRNKRNINVLEVRRKPQSDRHPHPQVPERHEHTRGSC